MTSDVEYLQRALQQAEADNEEHPDGPFLSEEYWALRDGKEPWLEPPHWLPHNHFNGPREKVSVSMLSDILKQHYIPRITGESLLLPLMEETSTSRTSPATTRSSSGRLSRSVERFRSSITRRLSRG